MIKIFQNWNCKKFTGYHLLWENTATRRCEILQRKWSKSIIAP